jgi:hypothetical protein
LQDNSTLEKPLCKKRIKMAIHYFILNGDTWYGKYGFLPYDENVNGLDFYKMEKYKNNQVILKNTFVKDLLDFFQNYKFITLKKKYYNENISSFLKRFRNKFVKKDPKVECKMIELIEKLFKHLKLHSFFDQAFYYQL